MNRTLTRFQRRARALLIAGLLAAAPAWAERVVTDMAGRQVHIPDQVHKVYAVGHCVPAVAAVAPDKLANNGRLPAAAARYLAPAFLAGKAVPKAGMRFSDEEILRMAPDLVVMETMPGAADQAARLEAKLRVPVLLIDQDLLRFKQTFAFLGEVLGRPEQAQALAGFVATYVDPIGSKARIIPVPKRVRVYYAEGPDGLSTNPAGSSHTQVLDYVGGINAARVANLPDEGMAKVSLEQLYLWRPDRILVWTPAADQLTTWHAVVDGPLWQRLDAVKAGRVSQIPWLPYSWFDRPPGSNRILGVLWLANLLYPEVFPFDMVAVTREYFRLFYHADLSAADARYLLGLATPAAAAEPSR